MKTKTYFDKTTWGDSPWKHEPDLAYWVDELTGYHCAIKRAGANFLCGYVGIFTRHPCNQKGETVLNNLCLEVHGGITYADSNQPINFSEHPELAPIEYLLYPPTWWIGFDCAHMTDHIPAVTSKFEHFSRPSINYRDFEYVRKQILNLANQLYFINSKEKP